MEKTTFRKGQKVVCTRYKDKPIVIIDEIVHLPEFEKGYSEVWVTGLEGKSWWGSKEWFKKVSK